MSSSVWSGVLLTAFWLAVLCCAACNPGMDAPPGDDGLIPLGLQTFVVQKADDGCALIRKEFMEGAQLPILIEEPADGVQVRVSIPRTSLPSLLADMRQGDQFRTAPWEVPISAQEGQCTARRAQYYEGRAGQGEYLLLFHSDDSMPQGNCGPAPIPCSTLITLSVARCLNPPGPGCPKAP